MKNNVRMPSNAILREAHEALADNFLSHTQQGVLLCFDAPT